jgi:N-methylhydantoinase B
MDTITPDLFHYRAAASSGGAAADADPILTEIIRHSLNSVAAQMMRVLVRTAFTPIIYEMNDFAIAVYDPEIRLMAQANRLPVFMGTLNFCIEAAVRAVGGAAALDPGDVLIYNMPYGTGSHAQDVAIVAPAFHDGTLVGYICNKAHWLDIGAKDPYCTDSTDVFQEGVVIPGVKLYRRGERNADIHRIIMANSRSPRACEGDLNAQVTSALLGTRLLAGLVARHGPELFWRAVARMYDHGEALMRRFIEAIPDGRYTGTGHMDDNGLDTAPIAFEVSVVVDGSRILLDFSDVPDAHAGPINCPMPSTVSGSRVAIAMLAGADMLPNEGLFRPLEVITRPGSMFHPVSPQPCYLYGWALTSAMEAINQAFAQAVEGLVPSGGAGDLNSVRVWGYGQPGQDAWSFSGGALPCGHGAHAGGDGGILFIPALAFSRMIPLEISESRYPAVFEHCEIEPDTGGPGRWRGGMGWRRRFRLLADGGALISVVERTKVPSWGQKGGLPGAANRLVVTAPDGTARDYGKITGLKLRAGTRVENHIGGGGGYGPPAERDPAAVRRDLREGYVTEAHARSQYGWS